MTYTFRPRKSVHGNVIAIAGSQLHKAQAEIRNESLHKARHQIRKRGKKMRALVRLIHKTDPHSEALYQLENARYRQINLQLSASRDATSLYHALRDKLGADRFPATADYLQGRIPNDKGEELKQAEVHLREGMEHIENWDVSRLEWRDIESGYGRSYRRAKTASERAFRRETDEAFHTLRKRVKDHWYQSRLLQKRWPNKIGARAKPLKVLASDLGDWRDLRLLCHFLALNSADLNPDARGELIPLLDQSQEQLIRLRKRIEHRCSDLFSRKRWK